MTTRTFKQTGRAYGSTPASIVATIDGNVVFTGNVPTVDEPVPSLPNLDIVGEEIYTWNTDLKFQGTQSLSIAVTGSDFLLTDTSANYIVLDGPTLGGANVYGQFYQETVGGVIYSDPFTNEEIDGVAQDGPPDPSYPGQWYWLIPAGSTFTATINIQPGQNRLP